MDVPQMFRRVKMRDTGFPPFGVHPAHVQQEPPDATCQSSPRLALVVPIEPPNSRVGADDGV